MIVMAGLVLAISIRRALARPSGMSATSAGMTG